MPTLAFSDFQSTTGGTTLTSTSFTPQTGDIIVVKIITADASNSVPGTPTGGGWTYTQRVTDTTASHVGAKIWTAPVTAGGTAQTVAVTHSGTEGHWSMMVELWRNAQLASTPATCDARGTGAPSTALTTVAANSVVSWANGDWSAQGPTGRTYNTTSATPTEEGIDDQSAAVAYVAYYAWQTATSAGAQTLGLTAPVGQTWTLVGIEIQDAGGGAPGAAQIAANPGPAWKLNRKFSHRRLPRPRFVFTTPVTPPSDLTINAPAVTSTGVSPQAVVEIDLPQTATVATGTAPQATPNVQVLAGIPTATGTAPAPSHESDVLPGVPTATGTDAAVANVIVFAGIPTATGSAPAPNVQTGLIINAPVPTATGSAPQPVVAEQVLPGVPTATGSSPAAVPNNQAKPGIPVATSTAPAPTVSIQVLPGIPVASAVAPAPQILTGLIVNAPAVTATGTAPSAVPNIQPLGGTVTATGTSPQPAASPSVLPGAPTATAGAAAVANIKPLPGAPTATGGAAAVVSIFVNATIAVATGTSPAPGIITGLVINAPAVTASGVASQPVPAETVFAGIPVGTGSAPATSRGVGAGIPTATGVSPQPVDAVAVNALIAIVTGAVSPAQAVSVLPHVTARSTSAVTAKVNSASGVADPREAAAAVSGRGTTSSVGSTHTSVGSPAVTDSRGSVSSVN